MQILIFDIDFDYIMQRDRKPREYVLNELKRIMQSEGFSMISQFTFKSEHSEPFAMMQGMVYRLRSVEWLCDAFTVANIYTVLDESDMLRYIKD